MSVSCPQISSYVLPPNQVYVQQHMMDASVVVRCPCACALLCPLMSLTCGSLMTSTTYMCQSYELPIDQVRHIIAFEAVINCQSHTHATHAHGMHMHSRSHSAMSLMCGWT